MKKIIGNSRQEGKGTIDSRNSIKKKQKYRKCILSEIKSGNSHSAGAQGGW